MTEQEAQRQLWELWRADWNRFVRDVFGVRLDREQRAILDSVQRNRRTSVASGTARGKDFVTACAALCFLYLTPRWRADGTMAENTKVALTAPTGRQINNIMMPEVARLITMAAARGMKLPGTLLSDGIRTDSREWFLTGFKADENNHEAWSGFHAVHTMFAVTEATGVSDDIFNAIEGNMQGDSRMLIVFNPNTSAGYAARSHKSDRWQRFRLNSLNAPNVRLKRNEIPGQVDYEWVADKVANWAMPIAERDVMPEQDDFQWEGAWYRPNDVFRKKVLGAFPLASDDELIPRQWIEAAQQRYADAVSRGIMAAGLQHPVLSVDVAGMGRDSSCYVVRDGNLIASIDTHNSGGNAEHMAIAGRIMHFRRQHPFSSAVIDTIGEGAGVYSRCLEQETAASARYIVSCKYSAAATGKNGKPLTDATGVYRFANLKAYLYWAVRDWLDPKQGSNAMLPPDDTLAEEIAEIRWFFASNGAIQFEAKDKLKARLGRSPDRFDAIANTFMPLPAMQPATAKPNIADLIY